MANTTNFGWETPDDTDLVKDGAAAMRTLGNSIDASFVDLKGGTTGQILSKNSNTDLDYTWINNDTGDITSVVAGVGMSGGGTSGAVTLTNDMASTITAAGDIVVGTGSGTYDNLPIGTTNQVLTADTSVSPYKVKWANATSGALILTGSSDFTTSSSVVVTNCFSTNYDFYVLYIDFSAATGNTGYNVKLRVSGTSAATNYNWNRDNWYGSTSAQTETLATSSFFLGEVSASYANRCGSIVSFIDPALARPTKIFSQARFVNVNQSVFGSNIYGDHNTSTAYDSIEIFPDSGNVSGSVRVYGYAKS